MRLSLLGLWMSLQLTAVDDAAEFTTRHSQAALEALLVDNPRQSPWPEHSVGALLLINLPDMTLIMRPQEL